MQGVDLLDRFSVHESHDQFQEHPWMMLRGSEYPNPIFLRKATSDIATFRKVILENEYALPITISPEFIIDAGANIGVSAIWFSKHYPKAKIIALEPEPGNFSMLLKNTSGYPNIFPIKAALWHEATQLHVISYGKMDNFQVASNEDLNNDAFLKQKMQQLNGTILFSCESVTVQNLMHQFNMNRVGLFKMDIEGSEKEVFENASGWIHQTDVMAVELHERWKPGSARSFYNNTPGFVREWTKGESIFLSRF